MMAQVFCIQELLWCPGWESNPHSRCQEKDFKSFASACFATRAKFEKTTLA